MEIEIAKLEEFYQQKKRQLQQEMENKNEELAILQDTCQQQTDTINSNDITIANKINEIENLITSHNDALASKQSLHETELRELKNSFLDQIEKLKEKFEINLQNALDKNTIKVQGEEKAIYARQEEILKKKFESTLQNAKEDKLFF